MTGRTESADITLRFYRDGDAPQVRTFKCKTSGQTFTSRPQTTIRKAPIEIATSSDDRRLILVAVEPNETIVGVAVFGPEGDHWVSQSLGVVEHRRRQGIGTALKKLVIVESLAKHDGNRTDVISEVRCRNDAMSGLNDKIGAQRTSHPTDRKYVVYGYAAEPEP
jgi:GNAT superfamily N-acetyltransferase